MVFEERGWGETRAWRDDDVKASAGQERPAAGHRRARSLTEQGNPSPCHPEILLSHARCLAWRCPQVKTVKVTNARGFCAEIATAITVAVASRYGGWTKEQGRKTMRMARTPWH